MATLQESLTSMCKQWISSDYQKSIVLYILVSIITRMLFENSYVVISEYFITEVAHLPLHQSQ